MSKAEYITTSINWVITTSKRYSRRIIFVVVGAILTWLVKEYLDDYKMESQSNKYIAVVMSGTDKTFTIPKEFKQGFGDEESIQTTDGVKINIKKKDDQYSVQQAKIVAEALMNDLNCVMIIGNSNSELTEVTLNSILDYSDKTKRPAFILPIATADNLISKSKSEGYESIMRMVPDNQNQAMLIKRFIFQVKGSNSNVAILVDEDNKTYSSNLSKNIASAIISEDGNIVLNQSYGNSQRLVTTFEVLKANKIMPDVIVYVGVSSNALLLIEELKAFKINIPVIFTDGSTVEEVMKKAKRLLSENAYFLSPVLMNNSKNIQPTYEAIGKDAHSLAKKILNGVTGEITRESVSKHISKNKTDIGLDSGFAGAYGFNAEGNNVKMDFKIYHHTTDGALKEVQGIK